MVRRHSRALDVHRPGDNDGHRGPGGGGEIVFSEETLARLGADIAPEDVGLREIKGVERLLRLHRPRPGPVT